LFEQQCNILEYNHGMIAHSEDPTSERVTEVAARSVVKSNERGEKKDKGKKEGKAKEKRGKGRKGTG
jgi:hypothetical protein